MTAEIQAGSRLVSRQTSNGLLPEPIRLSLNESDARSEGQQFRWSRMIPDTVHFVYLAFPGHPFSFLNYIAVLSASHVLKPSQVNIHVAGTPTGHWWEAATRLAVLRSISSIPTHVGSKPIKKAAHLADAIRMEILLKEGGIYLDLDTISVRPVDELRGHEMVMGKENENALCNAIIMAKPDSTFLKTWWARYEEAFNPHGWAEASVELPMQLYRENVGAIAVLPHTAFFWPSWTQTSLIFTGATPPSSDLYILHWWNTVARPLIKDITPEWIADSQCMYAQLCRPFLSLVEYPERQ